MCSSRTCPRLPIHGQRRLKLMVEFGINLCSLAASAVRMRQMLRVSFVRIISLVGGDGKWRTDVDAAVLSSLEWPELMYLEVMF
jgi:hypothetical protein